MWPKLSAVFGKPSPPKVVDMQGFGGTTYVIGDIHGCLELLKGLEQKIIADAAPGGDNLLVCIGDMVDRGPESYGVIEHMLAAPPKGFRRICLMGNHEAMMLAFLDSPRGAGEWLDFGGRETLISYGALGSEIQMAQQNPRKMKFLIDRLIPEAHKPFLRALPHVLCLDKFVIAHAGGNPERPLARQSVQDLIWGANTFHTAAPIFDKTIVHGHFVVEHQEHSGQKVAIDTGAYIHGVLTAAKLGPDGAVSFISMPD